MKLRTSCSSLKQLGLAVVLCVFTSGAFAAPTVLGTTISWPDDGWYQVQTADGSSTVCSGGMSCTVSPGTYLVINHGTGQRFSNIQVSGGSAPDASSVSVSGTTISWPDDGWYQVQNADTYVAACEGGSSCDVAAGTYFVINHTTGARHTVSVGGGTSSDEQPANTTINAGNYEQVLRDVVRVANLDDIESFKREISGLNSRLFAGARAVVDGEEGPEGLELLSQEIGDSIFDPVRQQFSCSPNGMVTIIKEHWGVGSSNESIFDQCNYENALYDGSYADTWTRRSGSGDVFTDLQRTKDDEDAALSGKRWRVHAPYGFYNTSELGWSDVTFNLKSASGTVKVEGMDWRRYGSDNYDAYNGLSGFPVIDLDGQERLVRIMTYQSYVRSSFELATDATQQALVTVNVDLDFRQDYLAWPLNFSDKSPVNEYPVSDLGTPLFYQRHEIFSFDNLPKNEQAQWQTGAINVTAADGSSVTLRPSAEDVNKVEIELNQSGEMVLRNWSDGFQVHCQAYVSGCGDGDTIWYNGKGR